MTREEVMQELNEKRHGDGAMLYAKEILALIEAHQQIVRAGNDPRFPPEIQEQRKALMAIPAQIIRQRAQAIFRDYFIPEFKKWEDNS